ncbi:MAG: hypothetical protein FJW32_24210, partial [Acidobacteria bacterium]|nr:hypothetical protein [Acidobacteriota bacterium]
MLKGDGESGDFERLGEVLGDGTNGEVDPKIPIPLPLKKAKRGGELAAKPGGEADDLRRLQSVAKFKPQAAV